jgi:hypothetical protein
MSVWMNIAMPEGRPLPMPKPPEPTPEQAAERERWDEWIDHRWRWQATMGTDPPA